VESRKNICKIYIVDVELSCGVVGIRVFLMKNRNFSLHEYALSFIIIFDACK